MKIKCTNTYADRESTQHHTIDETTLPPQVREPGDDGLEALWDYLYEYTGDGSGENENAWYEVLILESDNPDWVHLMNDWCG